MRWKSKFWAFLRPELGYKKNSRFGFAVAVVVGILMVLWSFSEPILSTWVPWLGFVPLLGGAPEPVLLFVSAAVWFLVVLWIIGITVRLPSLIAAYVGENHARALRFARWLRSEPRRWLPRKVKRLYRSSVRFSIRSSTLLGTLDRLFVVTVPYLGGTFDAWVTKVQRVWDHDGCLEERPGGCNSASCTEGVFMGFRLWVFLVDWPVMAMGRPLRYWMRECRVPAITARDAASQVATLGITAPNDAHERKLTKLDVQRAVDAIADSEPALVVAGVIDPDFAEELWIGRGILAEDWREQE